MFKTNCDNCGNQNPRKLLQECNSPGYPIYEECENWIPKKNKEGKINGGNINGIFSK